MHWDHVSGLDSLDVPLWMNRGEVDDGAEDSHAAVFRVVSAGTGSVVFVTLPSGERTASSVT